MRVWQRGALKKILRKARRRALAAKRALRQLEPSLPPSLPIAVDILTKRTAGPAGKISSCFDRRRSSRARGPPLMSTACSASWVTATRSPSADRVERLQR